MRLSNGMWVVVVVAITWIGTSWARPAWAQDKSQPADTSAAKPAKEKSAASGDAAGKPASGEAKKAAFAVFANLNLAKRVVVVDDDINPRDPIHVEWAMATRMRADRDIVIVPGVKTDRSEPMQQGMTVAKMGIDATRPFDFPPEMFEDAQVPKDVQERISRKLKGSGL